VEEPARPDKDFKYCPYVPYVPEERGVYACYTTSPHEMGVQPIEYTGWRDETVSWHQSCYIHSGLNPHNTFRIKGPEALKLLVNNCVNSFADFPIGQGKHGIACNEDGLVMADGVIVRQGEDEFSLHELSYLAYVLERDDYDAVYENRTTKEFNFQLAGPRSLEVVEAATEEDFHDLEFMCSRECTIAGKEVWILRMGMAGTLGYEVHGVNEDAIPVYRALVEAGQPFGIRRLGLRAYIMTHFEGGFPQWSLDFPYPWAEGGEYLQFLTKNGFPGEGPGGAFFGNRYALFTGSMGPDIKLRYRNPVELGWERMIKFDHDFVGRKALEREVASPRRRMVTLAWNKDDILDVFRSQFEPGETYKPMDEPEDFQFIGKYEYHADQVLNDGKLVGISTGRMNTYYYREMISLCSIDAESSALGTEVVVLWGEPGTRQKEIRAIVSRFPYMNEERNEDVDVSRVPRRAANK